MSQEFDSTIAVTIYNLLCQRGTTGKSELYHLAKATQHPRLERDQFDRAMQRLQDRRWLRTSENDQVETFDPKRRIVIDRDRTDVELGLEQGGWTGWKVKETLPGKGFKMSTLESVLEGVTR